MSTAIKVENLSKAYQLGEIGTGTLSNDLKRWAYKIQGKEEPFLKIGETNDRTTKGESDMVWSLKDINFEIEQGDAVGIIGRNGAGKSTLLKILSRVTSPTTGSVKVKGRVASLLEVGTGFHPELSGRENIFLNGAILGMRKAEIKKHFDAIVDFAGVERYIDTPVKRYSSGMYVRLAFAVAAHLESEILVVDEVLAVGDSEFQKKCLGKMNDVSKGEGRTVLFVSHNMNSINTLCSHSIYLNNGFVNGFGETSQIINQYLKSNENNSTCKKWDLNSLPGDDVVKLLEVRLCDLNSNQIEYIDFYKGAFIEFTYRIIKEGYEPIPNIHIFDQYGNYIFVSTIDKSFISKNLGVHKVKVELPPHFLNDGSYIVGIASTTFPNKLHFYEKQALMFDIVEDLENRKTEYRGIMPGIIRPLLNWQIEININY